ncbi:MAG: VOC family protein [Patescibacteria group bacterium]
MTLTNEVTNYLNEFIPKVEATGIDVSNLNLDHVAYQASSSEDYEKIKPLFEEVTDYTHEAIVGGRRVGVFKLKQPIFYKGNKIVAIELIEPKEGQICKSAWEHAEYVLTEDYKEFINKYSDLNWNTSSIDRNIYSHLKLQLDSENQVKFHLHDILETIKLEEDSTRAAAFDN